VDVLELELLNRHTHNTQQLSLIVAFFLIDQVSSWTSPEIRWWYQRVPPTRKNNQRLHNEHV